MKTYKNKNDQNFKKIKTNKQLIETQLNSNGIPFES